MECLSAAGSLECLSSDARMECLSSAGSLECLSSAAKMECLSSAGRTELEERMLVATAV